MQTGRARPVEGPSPWLASSASQGEAWQSLSFPICTAGRSVPLQRSGPGALPGRCRAPGWPGPLLEKPGGDSPLRARTNAAQPLSTGSTAVLPFRRSPHVARPRARPSRPSHPVGARQARFRPCAGQSTGEAVSPSVEGRCRARWQR